MLEAQKCGLESPSSSSFILSCLVANFLTFFHVQVTLSYEVPEILSFALWEIINSPKYILFYLNVDTLQRLTKAHMCILPAS